jgi:DNA-directed RNA polymerase specialized sigma24 family protein
MTRISRTFTAAVEALSERQRHLLALYERDRLGTERAAVVLGMSPAEARIELHRARLAVRQGLTLRTRTAA